MWPESPEQNRPLRTGLTTGTCATACCVAAAQALLVAQQPPSVEVVLPRGQRVNLLIESYDWLEATRVIRTVTVKDAGDDPDVTHGARIFVELRLTPEPGVRFRAGAGVGTVTRPGLLLAVGEPAINPVPRQMMQNHLMNAADDYGYGGGFEVTVGVEDGEALAQKTMNPRLGIVGGLSILGTTGIVRPFSCSAYIASIRQGVDVARSNGVTHIAATTGSTSEATIRAHYHLPEMALIEMGDFVGALLKHLRRAPVSRVSLCGGFGKISKLANGHLDLNSRASAIDLDSLAHWAQLRGASPALCDSVRQANTSQQALKGCLDAGIALGDEVCVRALQQARQVVASVPMSEMSLEVWATDRLGNVVGYAGERSSERASENHEEPNRP